MFVKRGVEHIANRVSTGITLKYDTQKKWVKYYSTQHARSIMRTRATDVS
jgi:ribosomal protein S17E